MNPRLNLSLMVAALLVAGCASAPRGDSGASPTASGLTPPAQRITDGRIRADRDRFADAQARLRRLSEAGVAQNHYPLAKAQCWLDTARSQYEENDRTGYVDEALAQSLTIVQALEADRNARVGEDTPLIARSTRLREDLWAQLGAQRARPGLACAARSLACAEVRLVRAGHAHAQTGWRAAVPHVQMAEDGLRRAVAEAAACPAPATAAAPATATAAVASTPSSSPTAAAPVAAGAPATAPANAAPAAVATRETFVLLTDALFPFDKADELLPGARQRLTDIAQRLQRYARIERLVIVGHTDRLGADDYNDRLSLARANAVRAQLEGLGVRAASVVTSGQGKREPASTGCTAAMPRDALVACLQPDRRVTIEVSGTVR